MQSIQYFNILDILILKYIKIIFTCLIFINVVTRKTLITYVAHIISLLNSTAVHLIKIFKLFDI